MEPIATYENTDLLKDVHSLTTIQYLAELNGINSILSSLENVTRFSLQQFKNCYSTFIECNATKEQLDKLISKAKEYYEGIEEYIQCLGYFYVFFKIMYNCICAEMKLRPNFISTLSISFFPHDAS